MCNSIRSGKKRINYYIVHFFTVRNSRMVKSSTKSLRNSKISKRDVKDAIVNRSNSVSSLLNSKHVSIQEIKPDSRSTRRRKSPSINLVELQLKKQSLIEPIEPKRLSEKSEHVYGK